MKHILFTTDLYLKDKHGNNAIDYAKQELFEEDCDGVYESIDDVPEEEALDRAYLNNEGEKEDFIYEFSHFIDNNIDKTYGGPDFLAMGTFGRWDGNYPSGGAINDAYDIFDMASECIDVTIYDEDGHLYVKGCHHDGNCLWEIKQVTNHGKNFLWRHYYDNEYSIHKKMFESNFYTKLPHFFKKVKHYC